MKSNKKIISTIALICILTVGLSACRNSKTPTSNTTKNTDISVNVDGITDTSGDSSLSGQETEPSNTNNGKKNSTSTKKYTLPSVKEYEKLVDTDGNTPSLPAYNSGDLTATDGQGRVIVTNKEAGDVKANKYVGINYYLWADGSTTPGSTFQNADRFRSDTSKVIEQWGIKAIASKYGGYQSFHYWAEPEIGYYNQGDKWAQKRHLRMLALAGVDFIYIDATNGYFYDKACINLLNCILELQNEGYPVPKVVFWSMVRKDILDKIVSCYQISKYDSCWFYWNGKPMILYKNGPYTDIQSMYSVMYQEPYYSTFTWIYNWTNTIENPNHGTTDFMKDAILDTAESVGYAFDSYTWSDDYPVLSMSASLSQFCTGMCEDGVYGPILSFGRNTPWQTTTPYDMFGHRGTYKDMGKGIYFQNRWNTILNNKKGTPVFVLVSRFNEWIAQRFSNPKLTTEEVPNYPPVFIDEYTPEYSRDVEPMKGGWTDDYYYQLCDNIRKYKGVAKQPSVNSSKAIDVNGSFSQWQDSTHAFTDWVKDTENRSSSSSNNLVKYTNTTGRNDIVECRSTMDSGNVYFYAKTNADLTDPSKSKNWMLLYIDSDNNHDTGWEGYDYLINKNVIDSNTTTVCKYNPASQVWEETGSVRLKYSKNELQLSIPRSMVGMTSKNLTYNFKWHDNAQALYDLNEIFLNGDVAPDRRWNYTLNTNVSYSANSEKDKLNARADSNKARFMDAYSGSGPFKLTMSGYKLLDDDEFLATLPSFGFKCSIDASVYSRIPNFDLLKPALTTDVSSVGNVKTGVLGRTYNYAIKYEGYIKAPADGIYTFQSNAVSGSKVYIDDRLIVDASSQAANGTLALGANSIHKIKIEYYFNRDNKNGLLQTNNTAALRVKVSYPGSSDADINTILLVS